MRTWAWALALVGVAAFGDSAFAQRAGDNALTAADDAFGTTVGNESVGLYSASDARGFSPTQASNVRIEGLYFDSQATLSSHLVTGSSIRVGLSAQSYAFPAPTGIADFRLRLPGSKSITSVLASYGPYGQASFDVDAQRQLIPGKLGMSISFGGAHEEYDYGGAAPSWTASALFQWHPSDNVEIIPFFSRYQRYGAESANQIFGQTTPPRIPRHLFYGQSWADWYYYESNYGGLARVNMASDWILRIGAFRSISSRSQDFLNIFLNTQADGTATHVVVADPPQKFGSVSGEVRLSRDFVDGPRRHTLQISARGRDVRKLFNGSDRFTFGTATIGVPDPQPMPVYNLKERSRDHARQKTGGVSYQGKWLGVGEVSFGAQKTFYHRTVAQPGLALADTRSQPWLYNGTVAAYLSDKLVAYAGYTRGLEESGVAPENAVNRGEAAPASLTKQIDAGLRFALTPNLKFVAGVFEVKKPYFDLDATSRFGQVGALRHRGVELSAAGTITEGLSVVFGTVLLQARLDAAPVSAGTLGAVPVGRIPRVTRLSLQYGPATWDGFSIDGLIENRSSRYANRANTERLAGRTTADLGGRYQFKIGEAPATLRLQVRNITNQFAWDVFSGGRFQVLEPRRVQATLAADF